MERLSRGRGKKLAIRVLKPLSKNPRGCHFTLSAIENFIAPFDKTNNVAAGVGLAASSEMFAMDTSERLGNIESNKNL